MDEAMKDRLTRTSTWVRGLYMLLFALIYSIAEILVAFIAIFQFFALLIAGRPMDRLVEFGDDLTVFVYEILQFVTFNSEDKPYPFGPWPGGDRRDPRDEADITDGALDTVAADDTGQVETEDSSGDITPNGTDGAPDEDEPGTRRTG